MVVTTTNPERLKQLEEAFGDDWMFANPGTALTGRSFDTIVVACDSAVYQARENPEQQKKITDWIGHLKLKMLPASIYVEVY